MPRNPCGRRLRCRAEVDQDAADPDLRLAVELATRDAARVVERDHGPWCRARVGRRQDARRRDVVSAGPERELVGQRHRAARCYWTDERRERRDRILIIRFDGRDGQRARHQNDQSRGDDDKAQPERAPEPHVVPRFREAACVFTSVAFASRGDERLAQSPRRLRRPSLSPEGKALRTAAEFDAARSRPEGHMTWGLQNRLSRIIRPTDGRTVMLAADHGYFLGPTHKLEIPRKTLEPLLPYADAIMVTRGVVRTSIDPGSNVPIVLRVSGGASVLNEDLSNEKITTSMEEAVRLNASAVALSIFVGAAHEHDSLVNLGKLVDEGEEAGIPVLAATAVGMPQGTWWDTNARSPTFTRSTSSDIRPLSPVVGRPRDGEVSSFAEPHFIVVPRRPQRAASRLARRMQLPG